MTMGRARVIATINDLSMFVDELVRGYVIMLVRSERGPIAEPIIISSWEEYERIFGKTWAETTDPLVAKMALVQGARLIVIRTAHYTDVSDPDTLTALKSSVTLQDRGDDPTAGYVESAAGPFTFDQALSGRVTGTEVGPFAITTDSNDKVKVRVGVPGNWDAEQTVTLTEGASRTAQQVVDEINAQTDDITAEVSDNKLKMFANDVGNDLEVMTVANDAYSTLGLTATVNSHVEGTDILIVAIDGGDDQQFNLEPTGSEEGSFELTAAQVVEQLAALTDATAAAAQDKVRITSDTTGASSSVQVQATSSADTPMGLDNDLHSGTEGAAQDTLTFTAKDPGAFGDDIKIHILASALFPDSAFDVRVSYARQGTLNEYYENMEMDSESARYAVNYINERSRLVQVTDENSSNTPPGDRPALNSDGTSLTGGDDGLDGMTDADWIGDEAAHTGLYAADQTNLALDVMIPGSTSVTVTQALDAYCLERGLIGYAMVPAGLEPNDIVDWRMGNAPYSHAAFNSHRLALWSGRPLVYDGRDDTRKYVSNLGHLAACLCRTDNDYGYHYAPVGPRRGLVSYVEGIDMNLADYPGYQDLFAEHGLNYLMITQLAGIEGAVFWEQRTTQRAASALRDLNVVRFLTYMRRVIVPLLRLFLFEPNHPVTWREVKRALEPRFRDWKDRFAIYDYVLQCDEDAYFDGGELKNAVLNSGLTMDKHRYIARALIQPTKAIYYIEFEFGVTRTGAAFEQYTELKELPGWVRR